MDMVESIGKQFAVTLGYAGVGIIAFALAFFAILKVVPFSIRKEIEEDHNVALAIVLASVILGVAWIVAATVHG